MNRVILMGRLTRDADIRTGGDTKVARTTIAVDRRYSKEGQSTDFINLLGFNKKAEFLERFGKKGTKLVIEGEWRTGNYTDKDGNKVYTNECLINEIEFAESKGNNNTSSEPVKETDEFLSVSDSDKDDMPF